MDTYLLKAAVLYALSATSHTSTALEEFLQIASFASTDLDPLAYELFDLRAPLERLGDSELVIPRPLQHPVLAIVRASGDALSRIDILLEDCTLEESCEIRWNAVRPKVQELKSGLCMCRRALQLALEAVHLIASKADGSDTDSIITYLDQDTSRVLGLIRRTLQQVQQQDQTDELNQALRSSLDEIRLLMQNMCKNRDDTKGSSVQGVASSLPSNIHYQDIPTIISELGGGGGEEEEEEAPAPVPLRTQELRPAQKLTNAIARWTLSSAKKSNLTSHSSILSSTSQISSSISTSVIPEDDISSISTSIVQTSRQASHRSESSHDSRTSSRASRNTSAPALTPPTTTAAAVPTTLGVIPPRLPLRNPRRSTLTSMDEDTSSFPSPVTPLDTTSSGPAVPSDQLSMTGSTTSYTSDRVTGTEGMTRLPLFAISPPDKIIIDPLDVPTRWGQPQQPQPQASLTSPAINLVRTQLLSLSKEKGEGAGGHASTVYHMDMSPASYILTSKLGDKTIKVYGLPQRNLQASLRVNFYIQMQDRSRDFFVTSHALLSETRRLLAAATGFGDTLEVWTWGYPAGKPKKKLQTIESVYRWAVAKGDIYETGCSPLACYREVDDSIYLYPVVTEKTPGQGEQEGGGSSSTGSSSSSSKKKPFGTPTVLPLNMAGLPFIPKLPELAYSSSSSSSSSEIPPLLVAAAGPRPPRPGHPPPEHAAMLMAWELNTTADDHQQNTHRPSYFTMPAHHRELETALPCGLAAHGDLVVSLWIPHNVRVIGRPSAWRVEPVAVPDRYVLVWNLVTDTTSTFAIPHENTVACISPDCRFVAYRQGPVTMTTTTTTTTTTAEANRGKGEGASLVILDARDGGRELWRAPRNPIGSTEPGDPLMDISKISSISFSLDGNLFIVGNVNGSVGVYDVNIISQG